MTTGAWLDALRPAASPDGRLLPPVTGPRRWWAGPLDVEGLALGSVRTAVAMAALLDDRAADLEVDAAHVAGSFDSFTHLRVDGRHPQGFAPLSRFWQTADGWVRTHGNYPHHAAALRRVLGADDRDEVARALRSRRADEVETTVRAAGGIAAAVRTPEEWRTSAQGRALDAEPLVGLDLPGAGGRAPRPGRLAELRVLDLTRVIAGPTATQFLALLGAQVLRVDPPDRPELLDQHLDRNFGKRSAVADLRDGGVLADMHRMLAEADVLVSGYRPGALAALGLGWKELHERHPHLVVVELDAWGWSGPWAGERGFDSIVQAATGIAHRYGRADDVGRRPGALPVQALDHAAGYAMAAAALALLVRRREVGAGGRARLSLARTAHHLLDLPVPQDGSEPVDLPVVLQRTATPHGVLDHVAPPTTRGGRTTAYPHGPLGYGGSDLRWDPGLP